MKLHYQFLIFCKNVKYLREKNGLSLTAMAKIMHVTVPILRKIEAGNMPGNTQITVIFHVARHFSYHPARLFQPLYDVDPE